VDSAKKLKRPQSGGSDEHAVLEAIRSGFNNRDAAPLASVYAEDAEYIVVDSRWRCRS
jgi:ketosteroid isomerase-like protein